MGKYFCETCKLFDDDVSSQILCMLFNMISNKHIKDVHLMIFVHVFDVLIYSYTISES